MDIDPIAIGIVGAVGLVALVLAVVWFRKRAQLLSLPVIPVERATGHQGEAVVVGRAAGEEVTSPWTERTGVLFSAKEVVEERRQGGASRSAGSGSSSQRQRRSHDLGEAGLPLELAGDDGQSVVTVQPDGGCDVDHLPMLRTDSKVGGGGLNLSVGSVNIGGGDQRVWVEERAAFAGDRLWVAGEVADQGGQPVVTGKVSIAGKDPAAQGKALLLRAGGAAVVAVAALGFAAFALVA